MGLAGYAGSGKSTVARMLVNLHSFEEISFAEPMKAFCREVLGFSRDQLWGPSSLRDAIDPRYGKSPREALQQLGTEWGRAYHENVWVDCALRAARERLSFSRSAALTTIFLVITAPVGTAIALAQSLPSFFVDVALSDTQATRFSGCYVNRWTLTSRKNEKLNLSMEIHAATYADVTFPTLSFSSKVAYTHHQATLALKTRGSGGATTSYSSPEFVLEGNNNLDLDRYENSQSRSEMPMGRRQLTLGMDSPFTNATKAFFDIYDAASITGFEGSLAWVNGSDSLTYSFPCAQKPGEGAANNDESEVRLPFTLSLRETAAAAAMGCVNVTT